MALAYARDEVAWYVRHSATLPGMTAWIGKPAAKLNANVSEELTDRQLPELLCYIEELRGTLLSCAVKFEKLFFFCLYVYCFHAKYEYFNRRAGA